MKFFRFCKIIPMKSYKREIIAVEKVKNHAKSALIL